MNVQNSSASLAMDSTLPTQDVEVPIFDFSDLFKAKPVIYEMIRPYDPLVVAMNAIENGTAAQFWEEQKKMPSVTALSQGVDWILGWGKYYKAAQKTQEHNEKYRCVRGSLGIVTYNELTRGLNATQTGTVCTIPDPNTYEVSLYASVGPHVDENLFCRIQNCIHTFIASCTPHCTPCSNISECKKPNEIINWDVEFKQFGSSAVSVDWLIKLVAHGFYSPCRVSKVYHMYQMMIYGCEAYESTRG